MSDDNLRKMLNYEYSLYGTYEGVAEIYGVSRALIWKIVNKDYEPKRDLTRKKFGLLSLKEVEVCSSCGDVHINKRCSSGDHKKRNRLSINLDDAFSAGKSIMNHMNSEKVNDLIVVLMDLMIDRPREG